MSKKDLGFAGLVEVRKIGDDDMTFVTGCKNPKAVSVLVRAEVNTWLMGVSEILMMLLVSFPWYIRTVKLLLEVGLRN